MFYFLLLLHNRAHFCVWGKAILAAHLDTVKTFLTQTPQHIIIIIIIITIILYKER